LAGVTLRNDTSDSYDDSDQLAWLDYPECAISVLEADPADLPLDIDYVYAFLASNQGNQDGDATMVDVGLQILEDGEDPTPTHMEWGPEAFAATVSSSELNSFHLADAKSGWSALSYTTGRVAVWVCAPDPDLGESWPRVDDRDTSGIVIDTSGPSGGSWLALSTGVIPLSTYLEGAWVIRASAGAIEGDADTDADTDTDTDADTDADTDTDADVALTSVTPTSTAEGTPVAIAVLGAGFQEGATLAVGGLTASNVTLSGDGAISATTPSALPAGVHDVVVTNPDGSAATLTAAFTVTSGCGCSTGQPGIFGGLFLAALARRRAKQA
jgi:MYXO-CTERM domain-containing protein